MFTGLIEEVGKVVAVDRAGRGSRLRIAAGFPMEEITLGESVAVNGVCLTVTDKGSGLLHFDVSPESMERTSFKGLRPGSPVNLERALRVGDRLGGHLVSGHVDCVAVVRERKEVSGNYFFYFNLPARHARYLVEKGSVTVDGISLTVNTVGEDGFSVNIIPHTAARTTLRDLKPGDAVNIETDLLAKYVERLFSRRKIEGDEGVSLELLAKSGFL